MTHKILNKRKIFCCQCGKRVVANRMLGRQIYSEKWHKTLGTKVFWMCPTCKNHVGTHKNGEDWPLGTIPGQELKKYRIKLHGLIDPLWKGKKDSRTKRSSIYIMLSKELGYEYHTGSVNSVHEAKKVWLAIKKVERFIEKTGYNWKIFNNTVGRALDKLK